MRRRPRNNNAATPQNANFGMIPGTGPGQNPRNRPRNTATQAGPFGRLTGMGPGQQPQYHPNSHFNQHHQQWRQSTRHPTPQNIVPRPSNGNGRRDGGEFGAMVPAWGYRWNPMYPGEATTDPSYQPNNWGPNEGRGFGELIPGIDGGNNNRYGYRETHPRFALAEWGYGNGTRLIPHIPGRGGFVRDYLDRNHPGGDYGYDYAGYLAGHPEARAYSGRARANMGQQLQTAMMTDDERSRQVARRR